MQAGRVWTFSYGTIGALVAAAGIVSLSQRALNIGLSEAMHQVLSFYRSVAATAFAPINWISERLVLPLLPTAFLNAIPHWIAANFTDIQALSIVATSIYLKAFEMVVVPTKPVVASAESRIVHGIGNAIAPVLFLGLFGLTGTGIVFWLAPLFWLIGALDKGSIVTDRNLFATTTLLLVSACVAAIVFFALNAALV